MPTQTDTRHCIRCGGDGPFAGPKKLRCSDCDLLAATERREYMRRYQRARSLAANDLIKARPSQFHRLFVNALKRVERESEKVA